MKKILEEYKKLFSDKKYLNSFFLGILILIVGGILSSILIAYADVANGNWVGDFFLENLPQFNLFWFRVYGTGLITAFVILAGLLKPRFLPALTKTLGLMYGIRALFIGMTHLKFYPGKASIPKEYLISNLPYQGNDLFFSGHVAFPFVAALIFWNQKKLRYLFLFFSTISGIVALLAKTHYSIDVFAAPFITYSIYKITEKFFKEDFKRIKGS